MRLFRKVKPNTRALFLFGGIGLLGIIAGGLFAAFSAATPSRLALWMSAYLVLVTGVAQLGIGLAMYRLSRQNDSRPIWLAFSLYNTGNLAVLAGTAAKEEYQYAANFVYAGALLLVLSVFLLAYVVRDAKKSWSLIGFYILAAILLLSTPIGVALAAR